ncbi:MAG TPA: hypothetical protein VFV63_17020 [Ilumatobacteraceae bacterium]|nr:hypothetical protein [Ilumatobacteraceae bacterium]
MPPAGVPDERWLADGGVHYLLLDVEITSVTAPNRAFQILLY